MPVALRRLSGVDKTRIFIAAYPHHKRVIPTGTTQIPVLLMENLDGVRYAWWNVTSWHRDSSPPALRNRATEEQKRQGWEMAVRIEKILCTVLYEAHKGQIEETMEVLAEGPEGLYRRPS